MESLESLDFIQLAFERAIKLSCGFEYVNIMKSKSPVKKTPNKNMSKNGDMMTTCAKGLFYYALSVQNKKIKDKENKMQDIQLTTSLEGSDMNMDMDIDIDIDRIPGKRYVEEKNKEDSLSKTKLLVSNNMNPVVDRQHTVMHVTTISEYGIIDRRSYASPYELGNMIISFIYEDDECMSVIQDIRLDTHVNIVITTKSRMNWHTRNHRLPCNVCGCFLNGIYGLRTHQITEHGLDSNIVRNKALDNAFQIVIYTPPTVDIGIGIGLDNLSLGLDKNVLSHSNSNSNSKLKLQQTRKETTTALSDAPDTPLDAMDALLDNAFELCKSGDLERLKMLVENATDTDRQSLVDASDRQGNNLLTWAAGGGFLEMCMYLTDELGLDATLLVGLRRKQQRGAVHWASRNGHLPIIQWLVTEKKISINQGTDNGTTPLHFAIWQGHLNVIKWIVEVAQCDVNQYNIYGCSASHWSGFNGSVDIMKYLFQHGVNFNHINGNMRTALHKAAVKGNTSACHWLVTPIIEGGCGYGLLHMQPEKEGDRPARLAATGGYHELSCYLQTVYDKLQCQNQ